MVAVSVTKLEQDESVTAAAEPGVGAAVVAQGVAGAGNYPRPAFMIRRKVAVEWAATAAMVSEAVVEAVVPVAFSVASKVVAVEVLVVAARAVPEEREEVAAELPLASCCTT